MYIIGIHPEMPEDHECCVIITFSLLLFVKYVKM